jgi:RND family efflux transporter MFP subunit
LRASAQGRRISAIAVLTLAGFLSGCEDKNQYVPPPPPEVTVMQPLQKEVTEYQEFTGVAQSIASVDIRARVQGFLKSMHFKEGDMVKKDALLYIIEPNTYQAALDKAVADLASSKAQLDQAEIEYQRNQRLMKENASSDRELTTSKASRDSAKAAVAGAEANLESARINLSYCTMRAPISGRIGRTQVDVGNLVGAGEFTLLTTIKQYDPIYAYFTLNERQLLRARKLLRKEKLDHLKENEAVPLSLGLADEPEYPHEGQLDYGDPAVDATSGTMLLRGVFPNPQPFLIIPGMFVRVRAPLGVRKMALLIPERAVGTDQRGQYLLVVNAQNDVDYRSVTTGTTVDGMRVIDEGLKADEWVIVTGVQRARPGAKVNPKRDQPAASTAAGSQQAEKSGKQDASKTNP